MDSAHLRHLRYYQGRSHGYYNQYQQYQPSLKESSSWSLWQEHPPVQPRAGLQRRSRARRKWCNILLAAVVFLIILAVILIAGLAIYMGALKLEVSQYLVLDVRFRVVSGDSYNDSLSDHSSHFFQRKAQIYRLMIESIFRRSDLSAAIKQSSVLGFTNGSLVVFFRLILDRRKIPKKDISIEERVRATLLQGIPLASPVKNLKIDQTQVYVKRLGEDTKQSVSVEDREQNNQTIEVHNGLLRKSFPRIVTAHYTNTPLNKASQPKTTTTRDGIIEGTFRLTSSESSTKDQVIPYSPDKLENVSHISTSSQENQTSKTQNNSSVDFYQHSPALNAFLQQKPKLEKVPNVTAAPESTEPSLNFGDMDLITLLPYVFQGQEEPWKPILPENFTRYPERRPFATEDYSSEGVGVVEVVLDPEDLTSAPSKGWPEGVRNQEYLNLENPVDVTFHPYSNKPTNQPTYGKETFGPRSDDKVKFVLNTQTENNRDRFEHYETANGDILTKSRTTNEINKNVSSLSDILPDFPILQQFHNLDALLRSYNLKPSHSKYKHTEIPVTLLPARSNLDMKKQIRPRPSRAPNQASHNVDRTRDLESSQNLKGFFKNKIMLEISSLPEGNQEDQTETDIYLKTSPLVSTIQESVTTIIPDKSLLEIETQSPLNLLNQDLELTGLTSDENEGFVTLEPGKFDHFDNSRKHYENEETTSATYIYRPPSSRTSLELEEEKDNENIFQITTVPETLRPMTIISGNHRKSKMSNSFQIEDVPLKFDLQGDSNKISTSISDNIMNRSDIRNTETANQSVFAIKLKDTKMQEILEKIIYNLTTETTQHDLSTTYFPFYNHTTSDDIDVNIAHNRKYGQSSAESKNGLVKNASFYEMKPDMILYYLKHLKNDSSLSSQTQTYSNSFVKNGVKDAQQNKSSPNYVLNKDGFLMLTKVYNKAPPANAQTNTNEALKSNNTGNLTDCSGSMKIKCGSGECINSLSRCNHLVDCADGSDEKNCTCAEFLRAQYLTRKICDGVVDCWDFSDENSCDWCASGQYVCSNSRVCIDRVQVCNGEIDCPNGDDEKNCVSIAPNISQADSMKYHTTGTLMIRKEGHWGKLCTDNFESLSSIFKSRWTLQDLGKVVCKTMTFRSFETIEHINDTSNNEFEPNTFYELLYSKEAAHSQNPRLGLTFGNTNCSEKKVVQITCSNLECGVRPQANPQWGRNKRLTGTRHSRIVGGGNAGPGSWPWLAALYKEGEFQCGATLISDTWLLSAGHCFYHALDEYWVARLGALRRGTNLPSPYEQLRVVSRILLHPNYVDSGFINDISLLQMEKPVSLTNYVRPICLPQPSAILRDGKMCTVIGWGQLFEVGRIFPDTLQEVQLPVISTAECRKRTLFLPLYKVTENMFCAGYDRGGRDACLGDSGGPLMCQEKDGHWSLMGVTSNGYGCARANRPGVYTKVANYVNWVHSSMASVSGSGGELGRQRKVTCHGHRCPLGECLPPARICNGFMECSDGSDEKDCW